MLDGCPRPSAPFRSPPWRRLHRQQLQQQREYRGTIRQHQRPCRHARRATDPFQARHRLRRAAARQDQVAAPMLGVILGRAAEACFMILLWKSSARWKHFRCVAWWHGGGKGVRTRPSMLSRVCQADRWPFLSDRIHSIPKTFSQASRISSSHAPKLIQVVSIISRPRYFGPFTFDYRIMAAHDMACSSSSPPFCRSFDAAFNPRPFIRTFEASVDALLQIRADVQHQAEELESGVRVAENAYAKKLRELGTNFEVHDSSVL